MIGGFLGDIPKQIEILKSFLEAGDAARVERQAHSIKGASANVGGEALRAVAFELEQAGKTGNLEAVRARLPELERQFARLKEAMSEFINQT
jgi:two-component system sensor histidine kinase/response regulator